MKFIEFIFRKKKALKLTEELHIERFKASDGCLDNFKERHSIKFRSEQGQAAAVDLKVVEDILLKHQMSKMKQPKIFDFFVRQ